jgi:hypothetical protein
MDLWNDGILHYTESQPRRPRLDNSRSVSSWYCTPLSFTLDSKTSYRRYTALASHLDHVFPSDVTDAISITEAPSCLSWSYDTSERRNVWPTLQHHSRFSSRKWGHVVTCSPLQPCWKRWCERRGGRRRKKKKKVLDRFDGCMIQSGILVLPFMNSLPLRINSWDSPSSMMKLVLLISHVQLEADVDNLKHLQILGTTWKKMNSTKTRP